MIFTPCALGAGFLTLGIICTKVVYVKPNVKKRYYEITLLDKITGKMISEYLAETKTEAFWKLIELYESLNSNYTFDPYSRFDSAMRNGRDASLLSVEENLKINIEPLKAKLKNYIKSAEKSFPVLDVYSNLIQEITCREEPDLDVFCCSICKQSGVRLADISFYFYIKSPQEHFDHLDTVICESCSKGFTERQKIKMGRFWADIVIGNKWHTLESFVKKRIGILRGNNLAGINESSYCLQGLAEYIYLLDFCWSKGFKVAPWRPRTQTNIVEFVNNLRESLEEE